MKKNSKSKFWTLARLFLLEKLRKPLDLILLLTIPSLSSILLLSFREIARDYETAKVDLQPIISSKVYPKRFALVDDHEILFAPRTTRNLEIINRTCADISENFNGYDFFGKISESKKFVPKGFSQIEEMEEYISRSRNIRNIYLGVHFHDVSEQLNFTIRTVPTAGKYPVKGNWEGWMGHLSSPTIFGKMITNTIGSTLIDDHSQWSLYYTEGFLAVQNSIQKQFLEQNGVKHNADQILQPSGQSAKLTTTFPEMAQQQLHLIFMLGFAHFVQHVLKTITRHRVEHRLDYLSLVGASPKDIILAHHFVSLVFQSIASAVLSYALTAKISTNGAIFPHTSFPVIWMLLTAYGSSLIFLCHLASTFFTKPTTAATIISAIIFFISVPHGFISTSWRLMPILPKIAIILNPTIMLALGCDIICHYQSKKIGLSLTENFYEKISFEDPLGMFDVIAYLLVTTVFYFLLTLSFEKIKSRKLNSQKTTEASRFQVEGLSKFYESSNQLALDNVSFKTEENEITALLGANGAGKSTLLNILCGFMEPTSGSDRIGGGNCGYCPQHNIFFEYLSVREHFEIFSKLSTNSLEAPEIQALAKDVQLFEKLENYPGQLSGGMLRKLTLGLSIIGRPKRLLLDEPTSGLDPVSRNELWGILKNLSASTSILMSTHYMDEAENLASSVLFLKEGKLCENGTLEEVMTGRSTGLSSLFELESEERHMKERKQNYRVLENAIKKSNRNITSTLLYQLRKCFILLKRDPFILFMQFFLPTAVVILTDISLDSNRNASPEASTVNFDDVLKIVGTGVKGIVHLPDYDFTMFPNDFFHAPPAALLHSHRTLLRAKTNSSIFLTHKPFDLPQPEGSVLFTDSFVKGMTVVYNCILAMMMMMSPVGMNVVEERKTGFRQIQAHTSALKRQYFWLIQYVTCLLQSVALLAGCMTVTSLFIKSPNFQFGIGEALPIFCVCLRFFIAHMPVAFIVGHFSEDKGSFVGHHSNVNFICTILMFMSSTCTHIFTGNEQSSGFFQLYGILPSYNFAMELFEIYCDKTFSKFCVSKSHSGVSFFCQAVEIDPLSGIRVNGDPWIRK